MLQFTDTFLIDRVRRTSDGYLAAVARIARIGIQVYTGDEVGKPELPMVRIFRPADEVFHADSMASFAHRPVTNDHPPVLVDAKNWKQFARGQTGDKVARDGEFVAVPMLVMDGTTINDIESGKKELSAGYGCELEWTPGVHDGQEYDAIQRSIRANHVAVVDRARGGADLRITDGAQTMNLVKATIDGISIDTTESGKQAIEKLTADIATLRASASTAATAHSAALATKDSEIATLKGATMTDAALDARVAERADLFTVAKALAPTLNPAGMSDAEIRKAVVTAKRGADFIAGKDTAYVNAAFDFIVADGKSGNTGAPDAARAAIMSMDFGGVTVGDAAKQEEDARARMIERMKKKKAA